MSVTHAWSGAARANWRAKTLGAIGNGCRDCVVTRNRRRRRAANPRAAVALPALGMDRRDREAQPVVRPRSWRRRARLPRVEARARHLERAAQQPHREGGLLRGDEPEPHGFSFAKKAVVDSTDERNAGGEYSAGGQEAKGFARSRVELEGDGIEIRLSVR